MPARFAHVRTQHASRYLQQLCKHFAHKVPVEFTPAEGSVLLPFGHCEFQADGQCLLLSVTGKQHELAQLERFVGAHLARFAFRENPTLTWTSQSEGDPA